MKRFPESNYYSIVEQFQAVVRKFINMTVKNQWVADDLTQETFIKAYKSIDSLEDIFKNKKLVDTNSLQLMFGLLQNCFQE